MYITRNRSTEWLAYLAYAIAHPEYAARTARRRGWLPPLHRRAP